MLLAPIFAAHSLPAPTVNRIEVVLEELISNVIRHGFTPGSQQSLRVRCSIADGLVELVVEDDGTPFNPLAAPEPVPFERIETARLGGLGVALVRKLSTGLHYEQAQGPKFRADGGFAFVNRVTVQLAIDEREFGRPPDGGP